MCKQSGFALKIYYRLKSLYEPFLYKIIHQFANNTVDCSPFRCAKHVCANAVTKISHIELVGDLHVLINDIQVSILYTKVENYYGALVLVTL